MIINCLLLQVFEDMNFLAHAHLSFGIDDVIFGNFVADSIKGKSYEKFRDDIRYGILLHREIDSFTDNHDLFKHSRDTVRPHFGKFSGIVMDIYYDHFLARNWSQYSDTELSAFSTRVYLILARRFGLLPPRIKRLLPFLIGQNWLSGYANITDLGRVFRGMDRRTGHISGMDYAIEVLKENHEILFQDFKEFYPQLEKYSTEVFEKITSRN